MPPRRVERNRVKVNSLSPGYAEADDVAAEVCAVPVADGGAAGPVD